jgi:hypothetical protein
MIIAFYPGAGGNRYYHYTNGRKEFESNATYDHLLQNQKFEYRYIDSNSQLTDCELILTHCVNVPLLRKLFPTQKEIVVITGDLDQCLKREWQLAGSARQNRSTNPVEDAAASIGFHYRYYAEYPLDTAGATRVIDIASDQSEFAQAMRKELQLESTSFDQALENYKNMKEHRLEDLPGNKIEQGYKSKFLSDAEQIKQEFDAMGNQAICLAKWKQVSLHLPTGLNNSCYHPPLHRIPVEAIGKNPSALHNTDYKKEQRRRMLAGERPEECSYCWAMEDLGKMSDRHYRSAEPWAYENFGKIISSDYTDDILPSYVEVNFNHACNLKCSYCSPQFSSSWGDEVNRYGAFPTAIPHNAPEHFTGARRVIPAREDNPYVDAFWQWWPELYPSLRHFRMTGGEPLMDRNTYKVLDYVIENPSPHLHLNVTSNFSVEEILWNKYLDKVKTICDGRIEHFMQYVSLDGWGEQAEYMRHGLDFNLLWDRVNQFLTEIPGYSSITFIVTMNNLSTTSLSSLFSAIHGLRKIYSKTYQRVWFDTPVLRDPAWQSLQILPESYADQLETVWAWMLNPCKHEKNPDPLHLFKDYEIARLDRDIAWMREGQKIDPAELNKRKADFYRFFSEHDRRRGTDFLKTFPEMQSFWKECEYHAKNS